MSKTREVYEAWRQREAERFPQHQPPKGWNDSMERVEGKEGMCLPLLISFTHGDGGAGGDRLTMGVRLEAGDRTTAEMLRAVRYVVDELVESYESSYEESFAQKDEA